MNKVYDTTDIEFLAEKSIYNESVDFLNNWKPRVPTDYFGHLKNFLDTINKNHDKMDSMNDICVPIFLHVFSICLVIVMIVILVLKRSAVYLLIFAGTIVLIVTNVFIECKKRDELKSVTQDIKVQAQLLKLKTQGQIEIIIISPSPKGFYVFSMVRYVIKLIIKYQAPNQQQKIQVYVNDKLDPVKSDRAKPDPFLQSELKQPLSATNPPSNNLNINRMQSMPKGDETYHLPMHVVDLYEDKQAMALKSDRSVHRPTK